MDKKKITLGNKILFALIPVMMGGLAVMGVILFISMNKLIKTQLGGQVLKTVESEASNINTWLVGNLLEVESIAKTPAARKVNDDFRPIDELNTERYKFFTTVYPERVSTIYAAREDAVYHSIKVTDGVYSIHEGSLASRDYFKRILAGESSIVTNPLVSKSTGILSTYAVAGIPDAAGKNIGLIGRGIKMDYIQTIIGELSLGKSGYGMLVDATGLIISHPDTDLVLESNLLESDDVSLTDLGKNMTGGESGVFNFTEDGIKKIAFYAPVQISNWGLAVLVDESDFYSSITKLRITLLLSVVIFLIVISLLITFITRKMFKPLYSITDNVKEIAEGEGDLTRRIAGYTNDEIGVLSESFNTFMDKLRNIVMSIKESTDNTVNIKSELSLMIEESVAYITQISANTNGMESQIGFLDKNVIETSSIINQIQANIDSLSKQIDQQNKAMDTSSSAVDQMVASLNSVSNVMERSKNAADRLVLNAKMGGDKLSVTTGSVNGINSNIGNIMDMVSVINGIAAQTNLLAMNAAIEAAHAGDAGRGFAVVADEIRKLAETSSKNSKEISKVLKSVIEQISEAAGSSTETSTAFDEIIKEIKIVSDSLEEVFSSTKELTIGGDQILRSMQILSDISNEVNEGSSEMKVGAGEMANAMENVSNVSQTVTASVSEIAAGTTEIANTMEKVRVLTFKIDETADSLKVEVDKFRT